VPHLSYSQINPIYSLLSSAVLYHKSAYRFRLHAYIIQRSFNNSTVVIYVLSISQFVICYTTGYRVNSGVKPSIDITAVTRATTSSEFVETVYSWISGLS